MDFMVKHLYRTSFNPFSFSSLHTDECIVKYGNANVWKYCCQVFDYMTLAAIIDGRVLCVHGGLSPDVKSLDQIRTVQRCQEIPHQGAFCGMFLMAMILGSDTR